MQIAIFAMYLRGGDAVGRQLSLWVRVLLGAGYTVRLFVEELSTSAPADIAGCTTVITGSQLLQSEAWQWVEEADLVICDYPAYFGLAECLRLLTKPRVLFSYHGVTPPHFWPNREGQAFLEQSRRRAALVHFADLAVTRSEFTRQELYHLTGYSLDRIAVVPCIVPRPSIQRSTRHFSHTTPLILAVGRLAVNKQPELLVEALAMLRSALPDARLVFVGDARGPSHAPVLAVIRRRAEEFGVADAVDCTGLVDDDLLEHLYQQADLLVSASAHEGFCVPVVEAMARGVPVVAMSAGAIPETVGDAGLLVPAGDVQALAMAMQTVLSSDAERHSLVRRGYDRAQRYEVEIVGVELLALLRDLPPAKRRVGLPRLNQKINLTALDGAAEVAVPVLPSVQRIPFISHFAARLRQWLTSDMQRLSDLLIQRQVAYNRLLAQTIAAVDELSAQLSEAQAADRYLEQQRHVHSRHDA
ncbi:MAG: glycosyltransferase family 4 protein [Herpetosiphonaceae bacterium]|nr:glycosyltransferase family 4 protein [Herpetosiphonaceae bacterium]